MDKKDFLYRRIGQDYAIANSIWETYKWFIDCCYQDTLDFDTEDLESEIICNLTDIQQIIGDIICEYFEDGNTFDDNLSSNGFYDSDVINYSFIKLGYPNVITIDFLKLFNQVIDFAESNGIEVPKVKDEGRVLYYILDKLNYTYPFKFTHP